MHTTQILTIFFPLAFMALAARSVGPKSPNRPATHQLARVAAS